MTTERSAELGRAAIVGARAIAIARLVAELALLGASVALARLLAPAEFGQAAVALTIVALAVVLGPAGITAVIVQRRALEDEQVRGAASLAAAAGVLLTGLTLLVGVTVGQSAFGHESARLLAIAAPAWLIAAVSAAPHAILLRELRFGRVALAEGLTSIAGAAVAVVLAALDVGPESLVIGALAGLAAGAAVAVGSAGLVLPWGTTRGVAGVARFAASVTFSSLVYSVFRNVDYIILSGRIPSKDVGLYWRAYQLGVDYQSKISQIMLRVSFPIYSRADSLEELRMIRQRIVRTHAAVIIPLLATFVAVAPIAIPWLFGNVWEPAVRPAQIMAGAGMAYAVATGTGPLMVSVGKPGALVRWSLFELVSYAVLIYALADRGLVVIATGVAVFAVLSLIAIQLVLLRPYVGVSVGDLWGDVLPGVAAGIGVLATVTPLRLALEGALPTFVVLVLLAIVALAAALAVLWSFRSTWEDLASIVRGVRGVRAGQAVPQPQDDAL